MRRVLPVVFTALLLCAVVAAQKVPPAGERIPEAQARSVALARVRGDLAAGAFGAWGAGTGGGIKPADVIVSRTVLAATGGKGATPIYLVFARAPKGKGEVRVALNAKTGAILNVMHRDWAGTAPDWWVKGDEDPVGTTSPRR